jgi:hypothetical protein
VRRSARKLISYAINLICSQCRFRRSSHPVGKKLNCEILLPLGNAAVREVTVGERTRLSQPTDFLRLSERANGQPWGSGGKEPLKGKVEVEALNEFHANLAYGGDLLRDALGVGGTPVGGGLTPAEIKANR